MSSVCYILKSFSIGDRSKMVYFLSREQGVLHLFVNSINKKKSFLRSFCRLNIDYYGVSTPLSQASNISTPDAQTISIQPFDKSLILEIEQAITDDSRLGHRSCAHALKRYGLLA